MNTKKVRVRFAPSHTRARQQNAPVLAADSTRTMLSELSSIVRRRFEQFVGVERS